MCNKAYCAMVAAFCIYVYVDEIVKTCILMCVCIIEFVVVLFKMLSCNALSEVSGTCLSRCLW
jgi:hypothetical protein